MKIKEEDEVRKGRTDSMIKTSELAANSG